MHINKLLCILLSGCCMIYFSMNYNIAYAKTKYKIKKYGENWHNLPPIRGSIAWFMNIEQQVQELMEKDTEDIIAFKDKIRQYYWEEKNAEKASSLCAETLSCNDINPRLSMEAWYWLADIYYNQKHNTWLARRFADRGIELAKEMYTPEQIDILVNKATRVNKMVVEGHFNTVQDLYILKSTIEKEPISVDRVGEDLYYMIYKTNW